MPYVVQLVVVVHEDVTEVYQIEHLKTLCKTHIHVQSTNNLLVLNLKLEHKRSNGKCVVQVIHKITNFVIFYNMFIVLLYFCTFFFILETKG